MKLIKFRVSNFKSIEDSGEISVDRVTCLVGKNESGKTALFEALAKLNPVSSVPANFELEDYPRRKLNSYKREHEKNPATAIWAELEISGHEIKEIEDAYGKGVLGSQIIIVSKGYDNVRRWTLKVNENAYVKRLVEKASIPGDLAKELSKKRTLSELAAAAKTIQDSPPSIKTLIDEVAKREGNPLEDELRELLASKYLPEFFYFDEYSSLPGRISLNKLKQVQSKGSNDPDDYTALALINLVGATIDEFLRRDNYERLKADLEAASNAITDQVFKYWTQNKELEVEFDLQADLDTNQSLRDTILHVRIENRRHRVTVPFDKRSRGFVWFFSFLVAFSDYKDKGDKVILLLDEPGLSLHAKAQADLLKFIEHELAPHHQVVYCTHSPFMIVPSELERVRTVQDVDDKGTLVSNDPLQNDPDTLFPLQAALGYDLAQTLFVGPNTLLVEGPADLAYLNVASAVLEKDGRVGLSEKWVIVPVGGAYKVATFVSLLGANQLNVAVFLDISRKDQQRIDNLLRNNLLSKRNLLTVGSILGRKNADIEDLFALDGYLAIVNAAYKDVLRNPLASSEIKVGDPRVMVRLEKHFAENSINRGVFNHYLPAYTLMRAPELQEKAFSKETKGNFETAFARINKLLV